MNRKRKKLLYILFIISVALVGFIKIQNLNSVEKPQEIVNIIKTSKDLKKNDKLTNNDINLIPTEINKTPKNAVIILPKQKNSAIGMQLTKDVKEDTIITKSMIKTPKKVNESKKPIINKNMAIIDITSQIPSDLTAYNRVNIIYHVNNDSHLILSNIRVIKVAENKISIEVPTKLVLQIIKMQKTGSFTVVHAAKNGSNTIKIHSLPITIVHIKDNLDISSITIKANPDLLKEP